MPVQDAVPTVLMYLLRIFMLPVNLRSRSDAAQTVRLQPQKDLQKMEWREVICHEWTWDPADR